MHQSYPVIDPLLSALDKLESGGKVDEWDIEAEKSNTDRINTLDDAINICNSKLTVFVFL